jgi:hypothetical protein
MSTCCNRMFHVFQMYMAYVSSECCKSRSGVPYVAMAIKYVASVCFKCFDCFKHMLQVFYLDIAYVAVAIHVCSKCFTCFKPMLQVFHLDIVYVAMLHMFQTYVTSVYSKYFICFKRMLQMCLFGCCSFYTHMLQTYVCKCFTYFRRILQKLLSCCNISRRRKRAHADAVPTGVAVPTCMRISRHEAGINCMRRHTSMQRRCADATVAWRGVACGQQLHARQTFFFWKRLDRLSNMRGRQGGRIRRGRHRRSDLG